MQHIASSLAQLWHMMVTDVLSSSVSVASSAACVFITIYVQEACFPKLSFIDRGFPELVVEPYEPLACEFRVGMGNS